MIGRERRTSVFVGKEFFVVVLFLFCVLHGHYAEYVPRDRRFSHMYFSDRHTYVYMSYTVYMYSLFLISSTQLMLCHHLFPRCKMYCNHNLFISSLWWRGLVWGSCNLSIVKSMKVWGKFCLYHDLSMIPSYLFRSCFHCSELAEFGKRFQNNWLADPSRLQHCC